MRYPMAEQQGLVTYLRRSHVGFAAIIAAVLTFGSLTQTLANVKVHDRSSHPVRGWKAERDFGHGWGWDATVGFYAGPFWGRKGKGYFRCLNPGCDVPFGKGVHRAWHLNLELTISGLLCDDIGGGLGSCITRPDFGSGLGSYTPRLPDGNFRSGFAVCKARFPSSYFLG